MAVVPVPDVVCSTTSSPPATPCRSRRAISAGTVQSSFVAHLQYRKERLLRDLNRADLLHSLLALFLLFEQFLLSRDVPAVALGENVLAQRLYVFARDNV